MNNTTKCPDQPTSQRRHLSAEDKIQLLRLHLLEGKPISSICDEHHLQPSVFYGWQNTFFENGAAAFDRAPRSRRQDKGAQRIAQLEAKLKQKDFVIAAVTEELVRTKKELGED
jgi:transposase-like protein